MQPYIGEIQIFAGNFAPMGWLKCEGQLVSIAEYDALFALIGTTYGGDGQSTFALPDLQGRAPFGMDGNNPIGSAFGSSEVTVTTAHLPAHSHTTTAKLKVSGRKAIEKDPTGKYWAVTDANDKEYTTAAPNTTLNAQVASVTLNPTGIPLLPAVNNMQPYQCLTFIIAMEGIFPSRA